MGQIATKESALRRWAIRGHVNVLMLSVTCFCFSQVFTLTHTHVCLSFVSVVCKGFKRGLLLATTRHFLCFWFMSTHFSGMIMKKYHQIVYL